MTPDPTRGDRHLAHLVRQRGWLSDDALAWCSGELGRRRAAGRPATLAQLVVERGWLSPAQLQELAQSGPGRPPASGAAPVT